MVWSLPCTPLPVPFLHTSHYQHIAGERGGLLGRRSCGETEFCLGTPLLFHAVSRRRERKRPELSCEDFNHLAPSASGIINSPFEWRGGEGPTRSFVDSGLGMGPLRASLLLLAIGSVADKGPQTVSLGRVIRTKILIQPV